MRCSELAWIIDVQLATPHSQAHHSKQLSAWVRTLYLGWWTAFTLCVWRHEYFPSHTLEQPGVKAPGTANRTIFLPAHSSEMLILLAGESSKSSTLGILSPSYKYNRRTRDKHIRMSWIHWYKIRRASWKAKLTTAQLPQSFQVHVAGAWTILSRRNDAHAHIHINIMYRQTHLYKIR